MNAAITPMLKQFYNKLADRPLTPDDPFYVLFLPELGGEGDPIAKLATQILWRDAPGVNLLSGQRGSGKSTELRRLKKQLETDGCTVFLCDMRDYMNLTQPVEISDFFISLMGALSTAVAEACGQDPAKMSYWERLTRFLSTEVRLEGFKIDPSFGPAKVEITASLKDDPHFKKRLQEQLRGHVARVIRQAHDFCAEAVALVRRHAAEPDRKVVLLVDSVEQIRGVGDEAEGVYRSVVNLFSGHADRLFLPSLEVVYTIPPYLTPLAPHTERYLGGGPVYTLPSVHIRQRSGDADKKGLAIMERIVARRCAEWQKVFSNTQLRCLAIASGGDLRDFFRLIRDCLVTATTVPEPAFPITDAIVDAAKNHLRRNMLPIAKEDVAWLRRITASHEPELQANKDLPRLAHFFDSSLVLNYRNGDDWYDVHPLLAEMIADEDACAAAGTDR